MFKNCIRILLLLSLYSTAILANEPAPLKHNVRVTVRPYTLKTNYIDENGVSSQAIYESLVYDLLIGTF